jgi:segregation and condensation protein B
MNDDQQQPDPHDGGPAFTPTPGDEADATFSDQVAMETELPPAMEETRPRHPEPPLVEDLPASTAAAPVTEDIPPPPTVSDLPPEQLRPILEALLFVSHRPLSPARLAACLPGADADYLEGFLLGLAERFTTEQRGWELRREAGGWLLMTRAEHHPWVRQLDRRELPTKLTKGAMETLAVVAYKQPVTRGAIEDVRGVQCGPVLRQLMDLRLVQVSGRDENALGRPLLYSTTDHFLQRFGLGSPADLPKRHEFGN